MQKSRENLKSADILIKAGMYGDSLSRSYYAIFTAARALLALKQLDSKKHSGVISLFNRHYVKTGIVDRTIGKELNKARLRRESSDYADFYLVDKKEAVNQFETAKRFIDAVENILSGEQ
ncbi:MAG: HEPN domain-containing protein [Firmicutes bacterium]|nr:HEPN domain-containing protein [Bacillota bacterium]